jgi:hypothetical protein
LQRLNGNRDELPKSAEIGASDGAARSASPGGSRTRGMVTTLVAASLVAALGIVTIFRPLRHGCEWRLPIEAPSVRTGAIAVLAHCEWDNAIFIIKFSPILVSSV